MTVDVPLAGTGAAVRVLITRHAIERFIERVRPGLDASVAESVLAEIAVHAEVRLGAPDWLLFGSPHAPYLAVGSVCFPLTPHAGDRELLVATTCLAEGVRPAGLRGRRSRRRGRRHSVPARSLAA